MQNNAQQKEKEKKKKKKRLKLSVLSTSNGNSWLHKPILKPLWKRFSSTTSEYEPEKDPVAFDFLPKKKKTTLIDWNLDSQLHSTINLGPAGT